MSTSSVRPVVEQRLAVDLFLGGGNLRIDAFAGTGKTTTLRLLAESKPYRALYLAFNRSIAIEAQQSFPSHVKCATTHSVAFGAVRKSLGYPEWKLTESLSPNLILRAFRLPETITFHSGVVLEQRSYAAILRDGIKRFLQSSDEVPKAVHVPCYGVLDRLTLEQFDSFAKQVTEHLGYLWGSMLEHSSGLPLGHDGYLKLWALSNPKATADYIMVDEAQDLNPVLLEVLNRFKCQIVYVGDVHQQIYEWRGAVNAMEQAHTRHRCLLSQSFRFGPEIAAAATIVLRSLGAREALRGAPTLISHIGRVRPNALLSRTNAGVIANVLRCLARNLRCAVVGGTSELERILTDVQRVKQDQPGQSPELVGFQGWKDVMSFSTRPEGEGLRALVSLVQEHDETRMLRALSQCEQSESTAQVICSTAHRAKGREWNYVHLDSDFEAGFGRAARLAPAERAKVIASEARLLYVAMTRARLGVQLPRQIAKRFGIRNTTTDILG
ncbi:superfamily I DNA/RNA helicase [Granulicella aggregans]|uniref:DNA 3'-5' helicase n=1 Tax=Granulicella aggregans TaxID=474949 RepID=A0A7W8E4A8_9BACT|nr:superfamily I DNA/RNA helicase [Granulicella aggregans]